MVHFGNYVLQRQIEKAGKGKEKSPGCVAQLVRALSQNAKVVGSIPDQGTYKNQPIVKASVRCSSLSL